MSWGLPLTALRFHSMSPVLTSIFLGGCFFGLVATALAEEPHSPGPWKSSAPLESKPFQQAQSYSERRDPLGGILIGARQRAFEQIERHKERQPRASQTVGAWRSIGPAPIVTGFAPPAQAWTGRVVSIAVDPSNTNRWLIGASQGGVWETRDAGTTWIPRTDAQASLAMGAIAFAPSNPAVVYAGTGDANFFFSYAGAGLLKSADGGGTWTLLATQTFARTAFSELRIHPENPDVLVAATAWGRAGRDFFPVPTPPPTGIFKSIDGGITWTRTLAGTATAVTVDPTGFNRQYAAIGEIVGSAVNGLYRSTDGGGTWSLISGPWNSLGGNVGRIALALASSNPNVLYVGIQDAVSTTGNNRPLLGLFRTDNAWASSPTWIQIPNGPTGTGYCGRECSYNQALAVVPTDPNTLYAGGQGASLWRCANCGVSPNWTNSGNGIHVDHHALTWAGSRLIAGNDGGVWSTSNGGASWTNHNTNLAITQFYTGSLHPTDGNFVLGGTQDNGDAKWTGGDEWQLLGGGDGFESAISSTQPNIHWATLDAPLTISRTKDGGASFVAADAGIDKTNAPFPARLKKCPANDDVLITGTDNVWRTNNFFSAASPTWTLNSPKIGSGISALAFAASDGTCSTYAVGTRGQLRLTLNGGGSWADINPGNTIPRRTITDLAFDPTNVNVLYVTVSGFDEGTPGQPGHLFKTTNALAPSPIWSNVSPPVNLPHNTVTLDPRNPGFVYVGTDIGVWVSGDGGNTWTHMGPEAGMPNVAVFDLKINPMTGTLVAFTYGRGAFALAPQLGLISKVNQATFAADQTLVAGGTVTNPGLTGAADFYVGILRPDNSIQFFTDSGIVIGNRADLSSFRPIASGVPLPTPFSVNAPNFYTYQWAGGELRGNYVFFIAALKAGVLAGGAVTNDDVLAVATAPFSFP
jgi:hypothetical protein